MICLFHVQVPWSINSSSCRRLLLVRFLSFFSSYRDNKRCHRIRTRFHSGHALPTIQTGNDNVSSQHRDNKQHQQILNLKFTLPNDTTIVFFANHFPESNVSAAGLRTCNIIQYFLQTNNVTSIHYVTSTIQPKKRYATKNQCDKHDNNITNSTKKQDSDLEDENANPIIQQLKDVGIQFHYLPPNDSIMAQQILCHDIIRTKNMIVVFDRFYSEEMYSLYVHRYWNQVDNDKVIFVLDMQDMHSLRGLRQNYIRQKKDDVEQLSDYDILSDLPIHVQPKLSDTKLLRELSSIYRCDLTLVCSPIEMNILSSKPYQIPANKLCLAPLFGMVHSNNDNVIVNTNAMNHFHVRRNFIFVGNFLHEPNVDTMHQLKRLWNRIRSQIPGVTLDIYGAYCTDKIYKEFHDPKNGFMICGDYISSIDQLLPKYRVMLAPIRYGAGIKGKIIDAWRNLLPVVTTPMGSEGMEHPDPRCWGGRIAYHDQDFVQGAVDLYTNPTMYHDALLHIPTLLQPLCCHDDIWYSIHSRIRYLLEHYDTIRENDINRAILWHQTNRSTEYFSKYIEEKNKTATEQ